MKRLIVLALVATLMPVAAYGDGDSVFSRESIDRAISKTSFRRVNAFDEGRIVVGFRGVKHPGVSNPRPVIDGPFVLSQVGVWGSTWWDIDSTRRLRALDCCYEKNPDLRSYVERREWGEVWWYQTKYNLGGMALTGVAKYFTRRNGHWFIRHGWVLIPTVHAVVGHVIPAYGNEQLFRKHRRR